MDDSSLGVYCMYVYHTSHTHTHKHTHTNTHSSSSSSSSSNYNKRTGNLRIRKHRTTTTAHWWQTYSVMYLSPSLLAPSLSRPPCVSLGFSGFVSGSQMKGERSGKEVKNDRTERRMSMWSDLSVCACMLPRNKPLNLMLHLICFSTV